MLIPVVLAAAGVGALLIPSLGESTPLAPSPSPTPQPGATEQGFPQMNPTLQPHSSRERGLVHP
jgi:hypothetical protein